ncbi:transposase family protein [Kitasatospora griseola]|uniref:transposase family protein n=1 Tax=Kitasatospora griseola TaxID=2064 RepID=UPI003664E5CF
MSGSVARGVHLPGGAGTAHACVVQVTDLLAWRAPDLTRALRNADPDGVLGDGPLAECDRVGDGRADNSGKHRRHGVNHQVITTPEGKVVWISHALPGRTHDRSNPRPDPSPHPAASSEPASGSASPHWPTWRRPAPTARSPYRPDAPPARISASVRGR